MATKKIRSIKGRVARFTRLDECGAPAAGLCAYMVTEGFIKVTVSRAVEAGQEFKMKNAWGDFCVAEKDSDRTKWVNVKIDLCEVDPQIMDIVGGATPIVVSGNTIGYSIGPESNPNAFAIEVWTKRAGGGACVSGAQEWGYVAVPFVRNGQPEGDLVIENAPMTLSLKGEGYGAVADWGVGPLADNPLKAAFPIGEFYAFVTTDVQPPDPTDSCLSWGGPFRYAASPGNVFISEPTVLAQDSTNAAKLAGLGYVAVPATAWSAGQFITVAGFRFSWTGTAWMAGFLAPPSAVVGVEPTITAADSTNAGRLAALGYVANPLTAWTTGQHITVAGFHFNWTSTAWAAGDHA